MDDLGEAELLVDSAALAPPSAPPNKDAIT